MTTNLCTTRTVKLPAIPADSGNPAQLLAVDGRLLTERRWGLDLTIDDEGRTEVRTVLLEREHSDACSDCVGKIVGVRGVKLAPTLWALDIRVEHAATCPILARFHGDDGWVDA